MAPKSAGAAAAAVAADIGKVQELPEITHWHTHAESMPANVSVYL